MIYFRFNQLPHVSLKTNNNNNFLWLENGEAVDKVLNQYFSPVDP